jgi:hypothetical protein
MSEKPVKNDLAAVEAALGALRPVPSGVDRDRLMYLAGEAAASRSLSRRRRWADWLWPCATAASVLLAVTFATMWFARGEPRIVYVERPARAREDSSPPAAPRTEAVRRPKRWRTDYLQLRRLVMSRGVDALPETPSGPASGAETLRWGSGLDRTLEELLEG